MHDVFSGTLPKGSIETITFPEGDSRIRNVDFACKAQTLDGARITLSAVSEGPPSVDPAMDVGRPAHVSTQATPDSYGH